MSGAETCVGNCSGNTDTNTPVTSPSVNGCLTMLQKIAGPVPERGDAGACVRGIDAPGPPYESPVANTNYLSAYSIISTTSHIKFGQVDQGSILWQALILLLPTKLHRHLINDEESPRPILYSGPPVLQYSLDKPQDTSRSTQERQLDRGRLR